MFVTHAKQHARFYRHVTSELNCPRKVVATNINQHSQRKFSLVCRLSQLCRLLANCGPPPNLRDYDLEDRTGTESSVHILFPLLPPPLSLSLSLSIYLFLKISDLRTQYTRIAD